MVPSEIGLLTTIAAAALSAIIGGIVIHFLFKHESPTGRKFAFFIIALLLIILVGQSLAWLGTTLFTQSDKPVEAENRADSTLLEPPSLPEETSANAETACGTCRFFAVGETQPPPCFIDPTTRLPLVEIYICVDFIEIFNERIKLGLVMKGDLTAFQSGGPTTDWQISSSRGQFVSAIAWRDHAQPNLTQFPDAKLNQRREIYFPRLTGIKTLAGEKLTLWFPSPDGIRGRTVLFKSVT